MQPQPQYPPKFVTPRKPQQNHRKNLQSSDLNNRRVQQGGALAAVQHMFNKQTPSTQPRQGASYNGRAGQRPPSSGLGVGSTSHLTRNKVIVQVLEKQGGTFDAAQKRLPKI